ncbi:hypothetical protein E2I00_008574, partial [Balaenoptera physalus]
LSMDDDISTSMVDSGSSMCRANLSEDHGPEAIFPSIMGNHSMTHHSRVHGQLGSAVIYASGLCHRHLMESSNEITHTVPIYEGYAFPHTILAFPHGQAGNCARHQGKLCYFALNLERRWSLQPPAPPWRRAVCLEGQVTTIGNNVTLMSTTCDIFSNTVLSGGTTVYPGFTNRTEEIPTLTPSTMKTEVIALLSALPGLVVPSWAHYPPSSRCGSASRSSMSLATPLPTKNAS